MADKATIGAFFKFLRDKEDRPVPLRAQFTFTPNDIDWEDMAYSIEDLNLIRDTKNEENIVWDKVNQSDFDVLNWVMKNSPENLELGKVDVNAKGILALLAKHAPDQIPFENIKIKGYVEALQALRHGKDKINWSEQVDYTSFPAVKFLLQKAPEVVDVSKIDKSDPKFAELLDKYGK
jgi:hypothetical protein